MSYQSNTQKVVKGMSSQTLVTLVLGVVEIVSFSIMSRLLSQEDFGYYAVISAITAIFASFSESGIGSAIVQQKDLTRHFVDNVFTMALMFGGTMSILLFALSGTLSEIITDGTIKVPLMLMSATLLLNSLSSVNFGLMHRKLQFLKMGGIRLASFVFTSAVAIWLAWKGFGYYAIVTQALLGSVLSFFLSLFLCKTHYRINFDRNTFKGIFSFSGWLMASSLFRHLAHQIDRLLMPRLLSVTSLGSYNRPKNFIESISDRLNGIFDSALFPVLSGVQENKKVLNDAFRRSLYVINIFALLLTLAFFFNSRLMIRVFFGEQWLELDKVMMLISCSLLFNIDGRLADCYLRSLALTKQQFYFRIFETIVKIAGVFIGYRWDIVGVAASVVVANFITKLVKIFYVGNNVGVSVIRIIKIITTSWRYSIVLIPICVFSLLILPKGWGGDILMLLVFTFSVIILFLLFPKIIGRQYYDEIYLRLMDYISDFKKNNK